MKSTSNTILKVLLIWIAAVHADGQTHLDKPEKYSVLHFRIGTNSFRELGFATNLFNKRIPEITTGFGYRVKNGSEIYVGECFSAYPLGRLINLEAKGPFFTIGYDLKNRVGRRKSVNSSYQVQLRRLKAENLSFGNHSCEEIESTVIEEFNAKAFDINLRWILDIGSNESPADFYLGIGICRRFLKKEIYKINNLEVNKVERPRGAPIMSLFFGLRLSFMDTLAPNGSAPNMVSPN